MVCDIKWGMTLNMVKIMNQSFGRQDKDHGSVWFYWLVDLLAGQLLCTAFVSCLMRRPAITLNDQSKALRHHIKVILALQPCLKNRS